MTKQIEVSENGTARAEIPFSFSASHGEALTQVASSVAGLFVKQGMGSELSYTKESNGACGLGRNKMNKDKKENAGTVWNYYYTVGHFDYVTATKAEALQARAVTIRQTGRKPRIYRFRVA